MHRFRFIPAALALTLLLGGCGGPERRFEGKPAAMWLDDMKHKDAGARWRAAQALGQIGPPLPGAVPALHEALKDSSASVRWSAASSLGKFGPEARVAIPELREIRDHDTNRAAREAAAQTLEVLEQGAAPPP